MGIILQSPWHNYWVFIDQCAQISYNGYKIPSKHSGYLLQGSIVTSNNNNNSTK